MKTYYDELKEWLELYEYAKQLKATWLKYGRAIGDEEEIYKWMYYKLTESDPSPVNGVSVRRRMWLIYPAEYTSYSSANPKLAINKWLEAMERASIEIKEILKNNEQRI